MGIVHIPRINGRFGGIVIPRALFDGGRQGLGVFVGAHHPDPDGVMRDVRRLGKAQGAAYAGRVDLPAGSLFALEMPSQPDRLFMQLGMTLQDVRSQSNAINIDDASEAEIQSRWRSFMIQNNNARAEATEEESAALDAMTDREVGVNALGAVVIETPFGRAFSQGGNHHAEWQTHKDGYQKGRNGRGSLFFRAHDMNDWQFLARGLVAKLQQHPEQRIGSGELAALLENSRTAGGPDLTMDGLRELIEAESALVRAAGAVSGRQIAQALSIGFPPHDTRDRSGRRSVFAQFSTPPAVGEVAAEFLKPRGRTVLEPTIGNGVFAAAAHGAGALVHGVEIDKARLGRVAGALPGVRVGEGDANDPTIYPASEFDDEGRFDAVLANPPYGRHRDQEPSRTVHLSSVGLNFTSKKEESHIATLALDRLKAGGNAVFVMPSQMQQPSTLAGDGQRFNNLLNATFRKVDSVVLDAHLYRNMGSNFPVIVHFCEDRLAKGQTRDFAKAARLTPDELEVVATFDAFYEKADAILRESRIAPLPSEEADARIARWKEMAGEVPAPAPEAEEEVPTQEPEPVEEVANAADVSDGPSGSGSGASSGRSGSSGTGDGRGRAGRGEHPAAQVPIDRPEPDPEPEVVEAAEVQQEAGAELPRPADMPVRAWFRDDYSPDPFTVPYTPRSQKGSTLAVIERTMEAETYEALRRVEEKEGMSVDEFVAKRMGLSHEEFMSERVMFYPEQVDSLALSFSRRASGEATIVGDQMGVGKGIQLAAHGYSALAVEKRPVLFMSNKSNLFSDFCLRDMRNASGQRFAELLESGVVSPFIVNADGGLRENEKIVFNTSAVDRKESQKNKRFPSSSNMIMMTYSQIQNASGLWRHTALKQWITEMADKGVAPVLLLDEVHKAAGTDSRTGMVIQDLIRHAGNVGAEIVYSSATSLKSGKNLPVYQPALPYTGLSQDELLKTIEQMPLAMQEVLANEMALNGSLIERKMSDAGVDRDLVVLADIDPERMDMAREGSDAISRRLQDLNDMAPIIAHAAKEQFRSMSGGAMAGGSGDKIRVDTTSVASQLDSFSRYMMGAVKGMFAAELIQDVKARGEKASIVSEYTADGIAEFVIGDQMRFLHSDSSVIVPGHPTMGDVLKRFAEKSLYFKGTDALGNITRTRVQGFDGWLESFKDKVDQFDMSEFRVNVFDRVREACEELGMTVEDITGRAYEFRMTETGEVRAFLRERPDTVDAVARYNRGQTDVLCLNSGSATGVSAQASPKHGADVRRRAMIKLAYQREITDERQVEGRVHRAGQIIPPRYVIPVTGFAADDRIANLFNRANRSLTSSTSATRENRTNATHAVDILNPVGEMAATRVLAEYPHIAEVLGIGEKETEVARKLLGRSVMLPLATQSAILSEVDSTFHLISDRLTAEGNNPLMLNRYEWNAEVTPLEELIPAQPGAHGVASRPLMLNEVTYRERVKAESPARVIQDVSSHIASRDHPFENMHEAFGYKEAIATSTQKINFEHPMFSSVTGRRAEGMRHLWPLPMSQDAASFVVTVMDREIRGRERKLKRGINGDEFREISEEVAVELMKEGYHPFDNYRKEVIEKIGDKAFEHTKPGTGIRALWNRREQVRKLDKILPLIEPGHLIALDARALTSRIGGMWSKAYNTADIEDGLVPALITSARYDPNAPFAESKMAFSVLVPGNRFVEGLTVSGLYTGMEMAGAKTPPIQHFLNFASEFRGHRPRYLSALQESGVVGPEAAEALRDKLIEFAAKHGRESRVAGQGYEINKPCADIFKDIAAALPSTHVTRKRFTLEGNLFAAMSVASSSVGKNVGEKVVYTDKDGNHRNAILLNEKGAKELVKNVKRKVERRSVVHHGLKTREDVAAYLRASSVILHGLNYLDRDGEAETVEALARFYPQFFGGPHKEAVSNSFAETINAIRAEMRTVEKTFPASVMVGGDVWRYAADMEQKAASMKEPPRGFLQGSGGPVTMRMKEAEDRNSLGFRDVEANVYCSDHQLAHALDYIDKTQMVAMLLRRDSVVLAMRKDHEALAGGKNEELMDRLGQKLFEQRLKSGRLAGEFRLSDPNDLRLVSETLAKAAGGSAEYLIGGIQKEVQNGIGAYAQGLHKARLALEREQVEDAEVVAESAAPVPEGHEPETRITGTDNGPSF